MLQMGGPPAESQVANRSSIRPEKEGGNHSPELNVLTSEVFVNPIDRYNGP